jgi:flagellar hook-length control protein FliK
MPGHPATEHLAEALPMTTTLSALSPQLPVAPNAPKAADKVAADTDATPFARELSQAQEAEPPSVRTEKGAKAAGRGKTPPDGKVAAAPTDEAKDPLRPVAVAVADAESTEPDADNPLPTDLTSIISSLLGLPAAPVVPARHGPVDGSKRAASAATSAVAPSPTDLKAPTVEARTNPPADGPVPLPASIDTLARQSTEPLAMPSAPTQVTTSVAAPAAAPSASAAPTPFEVRLSAALDSLDFAPAFSHQVHVLVQDGVQHARLYINPAEMGPITVQITLDGLAAQVHLAAEQPLTRQALEQAMPVLASTLREGGVTLSGGGVFEQARDPQRDGSGQWAQDGRRSGAGRAGDGRSEDGGAAAPTSVVTRRLRGAVDLIA